MGLITSRSLSALILLSGILASLGCAGPSTPLGAIHALTPTDWEEIGTTLAVRSGDRTPTIRFNPPRQVLHGSHTMKIIVTDPRGIQDDYQLRVRYHGKDVTRSFLAQARITQVNQGKKLIIEVPSIRLLATSDHAIEVAYLNPAGTGTESRYLGPVCRAYGTRPIHEIKGFELDPGLVKVIEDVSRDTGFNPAFTAALIAQESSFNPQSVSRARALGLTQVTPIAETEITAQYTDWPRYTGINDYPAAIIKLLVMSGRVNETNEWRLHPERSVRGGLAFAQMLADRWSESDLVTQAGGFHPLEDEITQTRLILASYNSGYSRVAAAINRQGSDWHTAPELKEARKYVNRIFSYCEAFQSEHEGVNSDENET